MICHFVFWFKLLAVKTELEFEYKEGCKIGEETEENNSKVSAEGYHFLSPAVQMEFEFTTESRQLQPINKKS